MPKSFYKKKDVDGDGSPRGDASPRSQRIDIGTSLGASLKALKFVKRNLSSLQVRPRLARRWVHTIGAR